MQALFFLLDAVISFFTTLFLLRFMMQAMRVSFSGQIGGFVVTLTNWAVKPLRRIIPGVGGFDWASLFAAFALELLFGGLLIGYSGQVFDINGGMAGLMIVGFALRSLVRLTVYILIGAIILQAVLSWINPFSPIAGPVYQLTRPLLDPIRRIVPTISGIDLSPLVAILLLQVILRFV